MRLTSFTARTASQAMAEIREAIGEDAVIIATTTDENGDVRITVACEPEQELDWSGDTGSIETVDAIPAAARPASPCGDKLDAVYRAMRNNGIPAVIGEAIMDLVEGAATRDPRQALSTALRELFSFQPIDDGVGERPLLVTGPPGAGKTQTIAKLAARCVVADQAIGLATIDTDRTAAVDHLTAYADALRLELVCADSPEGLADWIGPMAATHRILIDSAGCNHLNLDEMDRFAAFAGVGAVEPLLVLPAGIDVFEAADMAEAYRELGAWRMVATRIDMTRRLGSILAAAWAGRLAFAELSDTPRVSNGLRAMTPSDLAGLLLPPHNGREADISMGIA